MRSKNANHFMHNENVKLESVKRKPQLPDIRITSNYMRFDDSVDIKSMKRVSKSMEDWIPYT